MNDVTLPPNDPYLLLFSRNRALFTIIGIALIILGIIAIAVDVWTTLISVIFLGILLLIAGCVVIIDSFKYWRHKWSGFFLHLLIGILYLIAGLMLINNPLTGAITLTLLLGIFYVVLGILRILGSVSFLGPRWRWTLFSGIIALLLGILILAHWPQSSLFIIGLFVGIELIISGITYIMLAASANRTRATVTGK